MNAWQGVTWRAITGMFGKGDYIDIYTLNQWFVLIFGISILALKSISIINYSKK